MRRFVARTGSAGLAVAGAALLSACGGISGMDCAEIGERAREISAGNPIQIAALAGFQETMRADNDVRCTAQARLADGRATTLYLRAFEEGGDAKVAYQERPFP